MAAIRIIDDHLELANIGSNTHAQIDTHIAAADNYVKRDGSLALTADWDIGDTRKMLADEIRARDGDGLKLYDDAGNGIFVKDGGNIGMGTISPLRNLHIHSIADAVYFKLTNNITGAGNLDGFDFSMYHNNVYIINREVGGIYLRTSNTDRFFIKSSGEIGINTVSPTTKLDVNSDIFRLRTAKTPATAGAAGNQGDICWDAGFIYVCTATNSWERAAIAAW